jgi:indoleamine 2,3-dioxygenase
MQLPIPNLQEYGMKPEYGFLPPELPSRGFSNPYFSAWEEIIATLPQVIEKKQIRGMVNEMPVLSTSKLSTESEWQRAYTILCFIAHGYIWGDNPAAERLPSSISIPLLEVCAYLGTLPIISYAALCLWNFRPLQGECLDNPDNLVALHTFTGTADESWFYIMSVAVEARGAPLVLILLKAIDDVSRRDAIALTEDLNKVASILAELSPLLQRMHEHLSPKVFYNDVRTFIAGSRDLPKGLVYDDGSGKEEYQQHGGGSAAQSSLFQFCDTVLGIQHGSGGDEAPSFVKDMRNYMPSSHRKFLEDVSLVANVKPFIQEHEADSALTAAYTRCLEMLRAFRDRHIGIVSRYIVIPSKATAKKEREKNIVNRNDSEVDISGTAGAQLIPFLKQMRDDTRI